jgi:hypothetical protein
MSREPSAAEKMIGDFAPKLVELTDDVLFGDMENADGLRSLRDDCVHSLLLVIWKPQARSTIAIDVCPADHREYSRILRPLCVSLRNPLVTLVRSNKRNRERHYL